MTWRCYVPDVVNRRLARLAWTAGDEADPVYASVYKNLQDAG